ncbi:alsin-like [Oscarella lobularis]|uniref:alsin-like n=1 Tax=Oscarella lobularis TaxID=121494 RepID=UPI0033141E06
MSSRFFVGETASDEARRPRSVRVKTELSKTQLNLPVRPPRARDSVRNARKESEASSSSDNEAKKPPPPRPSTPETIRRRQKGDLQEGVVAVEEKAKIERENRKSPKTLSKSQTGSNSGKLSRKTKTTSMAFEQIMPALSPGFSSESCPPSFPDLLPRDARSRVVHEIYTSELTYVRGLEMIYEVFMQPLCGLLESSEIDGIFANITNILSFSQELLHSLFMRLSAWSDRSCIGDLFLNRITRFRIYTVYCNNYDNAEALIGQKTKKKKDFEAALNACYSDARCQVGFTLSSYLLTPVQRIPRYLLLLKELTEKTPKSHVDHAPLCEALAKMNELADYVNSQIREVQSQKALGELRNQVSGLKSISEKKGRTLIKEGQVFFMSIKKLYQCILFNDLIVFAVRGDAKHSEVELALELNSVWFEDLSDLDPATTREDAIEIFTPDRPYTIYCRSRNEKKLWLQKLNDSVQGYLRQCAGKSNSGEKIEIQIRAAAFHYKNGSHYVGQWNDAKRHGRGHLTWPNKTSYSGDWVEDERCGEGELTYNTGERYKGHWEEDMPNGYGEMRYCNDDVYKGQWKDGVKHGKAVIEFASGDRFEGTFVNGEIEGKGVWQSSSVKSKYEGNWKESQRNGDGEMHFLSGNAYKGEFRNNFLEGRGKMTYADGSTYNGLWKKNQRNGHGVYTGTNGEEYDGRWVEDRPHLQGKCKYSNGDVYDGQWNSGKRHGIGVFTFANGDVYEGQFKSDCITGKGTFTYADKSRYEGETLNGMRHGEGVMTYSSGFQYKGKWCENVREGEGEMDWGGGTTYKGQWKGDKMHGKGLFMSKLNGATMYDGEWENGRRHGKGAEVTTRGKYDGEWQEGMKHGKGKETSLVGTTYTGNWLNDKKHGRGFRKLVSGATEHQMWQRGILISGSETTAVELPTITPNEF